MAAIYRRVCGLLMAAMLVATVGCGGESVEDNERFKKAMSSSKEVAVANVWRGMIGSLRNAVVNGEGMQTLNTEMETLMEDTATLDPTRLPEEHQITASKIMDRIDELKLAKSKDDALELVKEMEELADTLPK